MGGGALPEVGSNRAACCTSETAMVVNQSCLSGCAQTLPRGPSHMRTAGPTVHAWCSTGRTNLRRIMPRGVQKPSTFRCLSFPAVHGKTTSARAIVRAKNERTFVFGCHKNECPFVFIDGKNTRTDVLYGCKNEPPCVFFRVKTNVQLFFLARKTYLPSFLRPIKTS